MAAGLGFKTFTSGEVLTAADTNGYLMQGVLVFASASARNAAITSPQEGQYCYLKDTNATEYYDGAAWVGAPVGDITAVTAGTGISGGGTSGAVTITNSMATTITTNGDLIYGTGSGTFARLGIGSSGQALTVSGGVPAWGTVGGSGFTQVATGSTTSGTSLNLTGLTTYNNYILVHTGISCGVSNDDLFIRFNNDSSAIYDTVGTYATNQSNVSINSTKTLNNFGVLYTAATAAFIVEINNCRSTTGYKNFQITGYRSATTAGTWVGSGMYKSNTAVSSIDVIWNGGNSFDAGSYTLWGSN